MNSKNQLFYFQEGKGKYAYSTENRIFVWQNLVWPLILELNRPWFTLGEYRIKRDELCKTKQIPKERIGKGLISLISKGLIVKEAQNYSIDSDLTPYFKKKVFLLYSNAVKEASK